jgi:SAM-dependent methyltransferase
MSAAIGIEGSTPGLRQEKMKDKGLRPCPACSSIARKRIGSKNGFEILACAKCSTLYTGHVPVSHETENYDEYYSESNLTVPDFIRERLNEIIGEFSTYRETNRLLDIGFGAGTILEVASNLQWEAFGLEVSKLAVEQARKRGFEVFHGSLTDARYPDHYFDVITSSEILEHLPDPNADLREIARILKPGGMFWATTPSARGLSFRLLKLNWSVLSPPEHIQLYSTKGVLLMLKNAGFSNVKLKTFGLNPIEIFNHFRPKSGTDESFDRVGTAYQLNEGLTKSAMRKLVKNALNNSLNLLQIGDSLKIYAQTK